MGSHHGNVSLASRPCRGGHHAQDRLDCPGRPGRAVCDGIFVRGAGLSACRRAVGRLGHSSFPASVKGLKWPFHRSRPRRDPSASSSRPLRRRSSSGSRLAAVARRSPSGLALSQGSRLHRAGRSGRQHILRGPAVQAASLQSAHHPSPNFTRKHYPTVPLLDVTGLLVYAWPNAGRSAWICQAQHAAAGLSAR